MIQPALAICPRYSAVDVGFRTGRGQCDVIRGYIRDRHTDAGNYRVEGLVQGCMQQATEPIGACGALKTREERPRKQSEARETCLRYRSHAPHESDPGA